MDPDLPLTKLWPPLNSALAPGFYGAASRPDRSWAEVFGLSARTSAKCGRRRSPEPVRDVRRREQQNDVLWATQKRRGICKLNR
jgi:hypothetical protein